jgi:enamine deaminase RidA (YjgF/YER057c/UK114 family)
LVESSHAIRRLAGKAKGRAAGSAFGGLVWVAAVPDSVEPDVTAQSVDLFAKLDRMLAEMGSNKSRVISATCYLSTLTIKPAFDEAWAVWAGENPDHWPQRTCVGAELAKGTLVEIKLLAAEA